MPGPSIVISATFTADAIAQTLDFWMRELGFPERVRMAPYNQVFQLLLDPAGMLAANAGGINIVLARFEDWTRDATRLPAEVEHFTASLRSAAQSFPAPLFVCPPEPDAPGLGELGAIHVVRAEEVDRLYPVAQHHDPLGDKLGHVPYTPVYFAAIATVLARKIHALRTPPYKAIAVDCDNTLWRGICGEDGPAGVTIDGPRHALQEFLLAQRAAGMLLCLCSKNNAADVLDTFRLHPEMPMRLDDFAAWRLNWLPKPENVAALAEELDLALDSFILLDDSLKECREMESRRPEVLSLVLPERAEEIPDFLRHVWAFDHLRVTEEDRTRAAMYAAESERRQAEREAGTLSDFLKSLQLEVRVAAMSPKDLARVAQLTQRTNQMNFTSVRRSEADLQALLESGKAECLAVHVSDRFGSYGLAGAVIFRYAADAIVIDTFLLSCRALGRGVEHRMLAALGQIARQRGLRTVEARFIRSPRNQPALLFLESVGLPYQAVRADTLAFRFPAEFAAGLTYEPSVTKHAPATAPTVPAISARRRSIPYARIATELRDAAAILARVSPRSSATVPQPTGLPRTDLERKLSHIWGEMLGLPSVGVFDNFFDLGGHSLLAVQLLSRLKAELDVELSLDVVYGADLTVAELAKAIELHEIEATDAGPYAALLAEIEGLSDEEVRELLARESGEAP